MRMKTIYLILAAGIGYSLVADDRPVFMLTSTFNAHVAAERISAARAAIDATEPRMCTWRDLFEDKENGISNEDLRSIHPGRNPTGRSPQ